MPPLFHSPSLALLDRVHLAAVPTVEEKRIQKGELEVQADEEKFNFSLVRLATQIGRSINVPRSVCSKILLTGHLHNPVKNVMWVVDQRHGPLSCNSHHPIWRRAALACSGSQETVQSLNLNQDWKCLPL